ncbi:hypothetical protein, partial [Acinetobacter brisouii]|uniref:hypothetical protein n=1 Tax=Acinetobacter brisouii TaxID=396323 RepID=UPI0005F89288
GVLFYACVKWISLKAIHCLNKISISKSLTQKNKTILPVKELMLECTDYESIWANCLNCVIKFFE